VVHAAPDRDKQLTKGVIWMKRKSTARFVKFVLPLALTLGSAACAVTSGQERTGEYIDDATITTKVKSSLASEGGVTLADRVSVETAQDVVQLSGFVPTAAEKDQAERIAWKVEGVRGVKNNIIVQ
jgi:osmotically-inducible protein OsmY